VDIVNMSMDTPYHHGDLRSALIEAALAMVEEAGPAGLSLRETARRAGVSHNAPYRHFSDREALLAAVAAAGFAEMGRRMAAAAEQLGADPRRAHRTLGEAYVAFALDRPRLFQLMFSPEVDRNAHAELRQAADATYQALRRSVEQRLPPGTDPLPAIVASWAVVHGLAQLLSDGQLDRIMGGRAPEQLVRAALEAFAAAP
jgi:AcrR family transcriptional regulator